MKKIIENKTNVIFIIVAFLTITLLVFYRINSSAYIASGIHKEGDNIVTLTSCASYKITGESDSISLANTSSVSDSVGLKQNGYSFSIENTCSDESDFYTYLVVNSDSTINNKDIKLQIERNGEVIYYNSLSKLNESGYKDSFKNQYVSLTNDEIVNVFMIEDYSLKQNYSVSYNIKMWISSESENYSSSDDFSLNVVVYDQNIQLEGNSIHQLIYETNNTSYSEVLNRDDLDMAKIITDHEGLFATDDNYTEFTNIKSVYYRGAVDNNWIYFGGYYWRIIRINGDSSIRLIYSGDVAPLEEEKIIMNTTNTQIGTSIGSYSLSYPYARAEYGWYMYTYNEPKGNDNSSPLKSAIDEWYEANFLNTEYEKYIKDNGFCVDRDTEGSGVGSSDTQYYEAYYRIRNNTPKLTCADEDLFTSSEKAIGNAALDYPVGTFTVDEYMFAGGGIRKTNNSLYYQNVYLNTGEHVYTITPQAFRRSGSYHTLSLGLIYSGQGLEILGTDHLYSDEKLAGVRPVLSIKGDTVVTGTGTWSDPFTVES